MIRLVQCGRLLSSPRLPELGYEEGTVSLSKSAARKVLLGCLLGGVFYAAATCSGLTGGGGPADSAAAGAPPIFVANPTAAALSVYPLGTFGNVPTLVTYPNLVNPNGIARD